MKTLDGPTLIQIPVFYNSKTDASCISSIQRQKDAHVVGVISNWTTQELQSSQEIPSAAPLIVLYSAPVHQRDLAADHQPSTRPMLPWRISEKAVTRDLPSVALFLGFGAVDIHGLPFLVHGPLAHFCACPRAVLCTTHALFATSTPASTCAESRIPYFARRTK